MSNNYKRAHRNIHHRVPSRQQREVARREKQMRRDSDSAVRDGQPFWKWK